jgi:hypothetical protein
MVGVIGDYGSRMDKSGKGMYVWYVFWWKYGSRKVNDKTTLIGSRSQGLVK